MHQPLHLRRMTFRELASANQEFWFASAYFGVSFGMFIGEWLRSGDIAVFFAVHAVIGAALMWEGNRLAKRRVRSFCESQLSEAA